MSKDQAGRRRPQSGAAQGGKQLMGVRSIALVELVIFFAVAGTIDYLLLDGSRFANFNPHPFWLPVIFLSIQYGTNEGLLAAFAATAMLLIGNLPEQQLSQDFYSYALDVSLQPILWQGAAVMVGELHGRQVRDRATVRRELAEMQVEKDMVTAAYLKLREVKDVLETRVAAQVTTLSTAYHASRMLKNDIDGDGRGIDAFLHKVLAPQKFSYFRRTDNGLETELTGGWEDNEDYATTIGADAALYRQVVDDGATLSVVDQRHEVALEGEGVLAGPVRCGDRVVGMLKIEAFDFGRLHSATENDFRVACNWISDALTAAAAKPLALQAV